jgi:shikimate 5-dehydrogenase
VVINATPQGLGDDDSAPTIAIPAATRLVLDLVYRATGTTPWVASLRARGVVARDGREVLLQQAVAAWAHWFPGVAVPVAVMRAARDGTLG